MLKKPCPYHKTPVNHTLEQCDMLKRFYGRATAKDDEAKKDGGDGDAGGFPPWRMSSSSSGGDRRHLQPPAQAGAARGSRRREGASRLPRLVGGRHHVQLRGSPELHPQPGSVPAGGQPSHREHAVLEGPDGRRC
jgi:hypothetical protein